MANKAVILSAGTLRENPTGNLMLGSALTMESIPAGVTETLPAGYQLAVYFTFEITGSLDLGGKLILL